MRLFVAVWPSAAVVEDLGRVERPAYPGVRWTTVDQWHVTLRFIGELDDPAVLISGMQGAAMSTTVAELGPRSACLGPTVLCLPVTGLDALAAAVRAATADVGDPGDQLGFRGHLTLARARRGAGRSALRRLPVIEMRSRWTVEEVTVVASGLGGTGSVYTVVGRVPLSAR